ncbi:MAG TPA: hypothetical protein P5526_09325, partial [Anaerolineae bacterium]|nr:hypothetical protein [Anaerolineae bacterium]
MKKNLWLLLAMLTAVIVVISACAPAPPAEEPAAEEAPAEEAAAEEPAAEEAPAEEAAAEEPAAEEPAAEEEAMASTGEGGYLDRALAGEFAGTTV